MVLLESEKKVRRRCWCGSKIQTATLPDGNTTTDFQNWRVSFGAAKPKRKRTKNLFGADYYFIEYRMPEAPFTVRVAIDRVDQVVARTREFAAIPTKIQRRLILKVIPRDPDPDTPVFDHRPAKTVKTQLKGGDDALPRRPLHATTSFSLKQLGECMTHKMPDLRGVVHDQVPAHEKEEHDYLIAANRAAKESEIPNFKGSYLGRFPLVLANSWTSDHLSDWRPRTRTSLTLEQRYMSDEIDLLAYGDLRDPERKEKRLHDMAVYPLPERMYTRVVRAKPESAVIKCMECNNRTCRDCMYAKFINCPDDRAFVLLHHIYCLKLGEPILHQSKHKRAPKKAEH
ncbi:hypothetical protein SO694_00131069 [Aureococcus anophagefferens]|uniref:BAH domain-containing protein n=1 Tax=Aureococcus anophagefferens TaxID=44056 RepID=A0ABR1GG23_AURAN